METIKNLDPTIQKDYYNKAKVIENENEIKLKSYETIVCKYEKKKKKFIRLWGGFSNTTLKHINDFRKMLDMETITKKQWQAMACENKKQYKVVGSNGICEYEYKVVFDNYADAQNYADSKCGGLWFFWVNEI